MYRDYILYFLFFCAFANGIQGQVGVNLFYNNHLSASDWDAVKTTENETFLSNSYGASLDYWFRLKNYRVEFLPEIGVRFGSHVGSGFDDIDIEFNTQNYYFLANTNIYIFDLEGDCNCPTFGKEGGLFKKGFYVQVGPGVTLFSVDPSLDEYELTKSLAFFYNLGIGLDIGLAKYLTVTPWLRFQQTLSQNFQDIYYNATGDAFNTDDISSNVNDLQFGLRIGYRFDYKKSQRF